MAKELFFSKNYNQEWSKKIPDCRRGYSGWKQAKAKIRVPLRLSNILLHFYPRADSDLYYLVYVLWNVTLPWRQSRIESEKCVLSPNGFVILRYHWLTL